MSNLGRTPEEIMLHAKAVVQEALKQGLTDEQKEAVLRGLEKDIEGKLGPAHERPSEVVLSLKQLLGLRDECFTPVPS